ncbi:hypothetical protein ACX93W_26610 [Paenibacillus sp. CAU 1782]
MALQLAFESVHGIQLPEAYVRIDELSGGKSGISLRVRYYANIDAANAGKEWIQESIHTFEPSIEEGASNFLEQGYDQLKTLEEFAAAIDC